MKFTYLAQPVRRYTFEAPKLKAWVESRCEGRVLNLFAGKTLLNANEYRVDLDIDTPADLHLDVRKAVNILAKRRRKFNTIIIDPPYNWRKAKEKYGSRMIGQFPQLKNELLSIIPINGRVITFGYDTVGMGKTRGFKKIEICVICHGGETHDTLCVIEKRI